MRPGRFDPRPALCALALVALAAPCPSAFAQTASGTLTGKRPFMAVLNGGQVVPPSISNAMGVAYLTFDPATKRLCYAITYSGLQGVETMAHLHGGPTGTAAEVFYDLTPTGSPKLGCLGPLRAPEERKLMKGQTYLNIHTDLYVAGEIRGQVLPQRTGQ